MSRYLIAELSEVMAETHKVPEPTEFGVKEARLLFGLKVGEIGNVELIPQEYVTSEVIG